MTTKLSQADATLIIDSCISALLLLRGEAATDRGLCGLKAIIKTLQDTHDKIVSDAKAAAEELEKAKKPQLRLV